MGLEKDMALVEKGMALGKRAWRWEKGAWRGAMLKGAGGNTNLSNQASVSPSPFMHGAAPCPFFPAPCLFFPALCPFPAPCVFMASIVLTAS